MNMSFIEKLITIFKYIGSSFAAIELFIISLLLFVLLVVNIKKKNKIINIIIICLCLFIPITVAVCYTPYVVNSIDTLMSFIMKYIYFPSTVAYFFIMCFVIGLLIYSMFSQKITIPKKIINYIICSITIFFFLSFITIAIVNNINLSSQAKLYSNEVILSIVQISNLLLLFWLVFTIFYQLYKLFQRKFD